MKKTTLLLCLLGGFFTPALFAQTGSLDQSFGEQGIVRTTIGDLAEINAILLQPDGKIIAAGYAKSIGTFTIARYLKNGQLDPTFHSDGIHPIPFGDAGFAFALALQDDGKIIVAGSMRSTGMGDDFALLRLLPDGSLDTSFNGTGQVTTSIHFLDGSNAVAVQEDGKIVATGSTLNGNEFEMAMVRYHSDGQLDNDFGNKGIVTTDLRDRTDVAYDLALLEDGKILVAGKSNNSIDNDMVVVRYLPDGKLDESFGNSGFGAADFDGGHDVAFAMTLQEDGKIILGGYSRSDPDPGSDTDFAMARFQANGLLDENFGEEGLFTSELGGFDGIHDLAVQKDGKIVAIGYSFKGDVVEVSTADFALARVHSDGTLDRQFSHHLGKADIANTLALQEDGKVIVAGFSSGAGQKDFTLVRYHSHLIVGTQEITLNNSVLHIYPNPAEEEAILDYTLAEAAEVTICLYDVQGKWLQTFVDRKMQNAGLHQQTLVFLKGLPAGAYSVVLETTTGRASTAIIKAE